MSSSELFIRDYKMGDEQGIIELMSTHWRHFGSVDALSFWKWEYAACPAGHALIQVAEHKGKIVGHYALLPLEIKCGNDTLFGAKAEGSIVHPDYRGTNIQRLFPGNNSIRVFDRLIKMAFERAKGLGIDLIYGFPLENALTPQVKAGYKHMRESMVTLILPLNVTNTIDFLLYSGIKNSRLRHGVSIFAGPLYKARFLNKKLKLCESSSVSVNDCTDLGNEINDFWAIYAATESDITIMREKRFLQWRFLNNPVIKHKIFVSRQEGKITGYIMVCLSTVLGRSIGNIVDFLFLRDRIVDANLLVQKAISFFKSANVDFCRVWLSNSAFNIWKTVFTVNGFACLSTARLDVIVKPSNRLNFEQVLNSNNWFITTAFMEGVS